MTPARRTVLVRVHGRVQGVWFRGWTVKQAAARGLDGWVRNRADGTVEALLAGDPDAVDAMLAALRRGPPAAAVTRVETAAGEDPGESGFTQRPTA